VDGILRITLSNTLLAAVLALVALAVSRTFRRPALSHALWLIVLLKLITPPLWNVALPLMPAEKTHKPPLPPTELSIPPAEEHDPIQVAASVDADPAQFWGDEKPQETYQGAPMTVIAKRPAPPRLSRAVWLLIIWSAGSGLCLLIIGLRVRRFSSLLRFADPADAHVQMLARALSSRVGITKCPRVWFVPGPVCPMLWAFGRKARLLIPAGLWDRLDDGQRSTLLLHELAHYRRGDHWIRVLELLIAILFWWNPIAWWARHELREAEEQCCDAWVVWTLPRAARDYAIALMEAIDFVSATRQGAPVLASPMGEFHDLKRRLLMIKQNTAPRALGWTGFSLICGLALILLPLSATLAQVEKPQPAGLPPVGPAVEAPVTQPPAGVGVGVGDIGAGVTATADDDPNATAQREAQALEEELQKTSAEIQKLTARLRAAQERLAELQRTRPRVVGQLHTRTGGYPALANQNRGRTTTAAPNPTMGNMAGATGYGGGYGGTAAPVNNDQEQRLRTVERKLDMLIEELHAMHTDRQDRQIETTPDRPALRAR